MTSLAIVKQIIALGPIVFKYVLYEFDVCTCDIPRPIFLVYFDSLTHLGHIYTVTT